MADTVHFSPDDLADLDRQFKHLVHGQGFSVIGADKSPTQRRTLATEFRGAGFESVEEVEKSQAVQTLLPKCEGKIVLIIDLDLPGMAVPALIKYFVKNHPDGIPVVVGNKPSREKVAEAVAAGACAFFPKPVDFYELRRDLGQHGIVVRK